MRRGSPRILLVEPPFYRLYRETFSVGRYPLSLGYLAGTILKESDWEVMCYVADFYPEPETMKVSYLAGPGFQNYLDNLKNPSGKVWQEVRATIEEYKPEIVGISAKTQNFAAARIVAKIAKEVNKETLVIMGGPHPSMAGERLLEYPEIDIVVQGEAETTIVELLNAIAKETSFAGIKGISYRTDDRVVVNPPRELRSDLDSLCFPHENAPRVLKDYAHFPSTAFRSIFATRGCPFNCFFCGARQIWSRRVRFRSPRNVLAEIKVLQGMGVSRVHFGDDTFGVNRRYLSNLCNALVAGSPGLRWSCETHVRLIDEGTVSLMKAAGCYSIAIGIESGNNEILKHLRKTVTIEEALTACEIVRKHKIQLSAFFMIGLPWETEDMLKDTVAAMKKLKGADIAYSIFTPYPGTEMFDFCKENGLVSDDFDVSLYNHQSPANCFSLHITPERFRVLASNIERMVDRRMWRNRVRAQFSMAVFGRIREVGLSRSLRVGIKLLLGK